MNLSPEQLAKIRDFAKRSPDEVRNEVIAELRREGKSEREIA